MVEINALYQNLRKVNECVQTHCTTCKLISDRHMALHYAWQCWIDMRRVDRIRDLCTPPVYCGMSHIHSVVLSRALPAVD